MKIRIKGLKNAIFMAIILPIVAILPISSVNADIVEHLYEVEMPVEGQGPEERAYIVREALKEVLVRVSGLSAASALAMDEVLVSRPTGFVEQFRYRPFSADEIIPPAPEGKKNYTQKLWLRFTEKSIATLLTAKGLPVWGQTRPVTLIWLAVDDQKQRTLVGSNTAHFSHDYIELEAKKRGLPFRLPLLDLADQLKLPVTDVWGNFEDTIFDASTRYQAEAILVGRIYLSFANTWHTRWTLYSGGKRQDWEVSNTETLQGAINGGLSVTAEALSIRFTKANDSQASDTVMIQVKNVSNLGAYNKVIEYLKSFTIISDLQPYQVNRDNMFIKINSNSGRLGVAQAIGLGHMLVLDTAQPVAQQNSTENVAPDKKSKQIQAELVYKLLQ